MPDVPQSPSNEWHYCQRCRHRLSDSFDPDQMPRCPECRLPYDPNDSTTFDTLRRPEPWKSVAATFALAMIFGVGVYWAIFELSTLGPNGALGAGIFLAVPFAVGAILGFLVRPGIWLALVLGGIAIPTIVASLMCLGLHGYLCGISLSVIFIVPTLAGAISGALLRVVFYNAAWDGRRYFMLGGLMLVPFVVDQVEKRCFPMEEQLEEVRTTVDFPAPPAATWESIVFFEEIREQPPWLLRYTLPQPLYAIGSKQAVGDRERCVYSNGHLVKVITERVENERLAFHVVEQRLR